MTLPGDPNHWWCLASYISQGREEDKTLRMMPTTLQSLELHVGSCL